VIKRILLSVFKIGLFSGFLSGVLFAIAACSDEQAVNQQLSTISPESAPDKLIRFGLSNAPVTLDPLQATDAVSGRINRLIYQRLVEFGADNKPVPGIADWQQINAQHYRFRIIKNSRSIPITLFPAFLVIGIVPEDLLKTGHLFNKKPVGSGAFKFSHWPFDDQLFLRRQTDQQLFEFLKVTNPTVRVLKLLRGELDLIQNNLPPEHIAFLKDNVNVKFLTQSGSNYSYLGFNLKDEITGQSQLRKAIAYALDREKIIRYALGDAARTANGFFPAQHWAGAQLKNYNFDQKRALELMHQLGYSKQKRLQLSYKTSSDPFRIRIATIIQSQLKEIFIDVDIHSYDWGTFYGDIKSGHFQLYSLTWVGINTPDIFRYVFHSESLPPSGANRGRLNNKKIDQLIEQAEQENDLAVQAQIYQLLQEQLHQLLPYVSLWYEDNIAFFRDDIEAYSVSSDGNYDALKNVHRLHKVQNDS